MAFSGWFVSNSKLPIERRASGNFLLMLRAFFKWKADLSNSSLSRYRIPNWVCALKFSGSFSITKRKCGIGASLSSEYYYKAFAIPKFALTELGSILKACLKYLTALCPSYKLANKFAKCIHAPKWFWSIYKHFL